MTNRHGSLPAQGRSWAQIKSEMESLAENDFDWRAGRLGVYVFNAGEDVRTVARDAYSMFISENGLGPAAFPSLRRMEDEVVGFGLSLLEAPEDACGDMTSGGTESILMAVKTCRDWWRAQGETERTEIVAPHSAHPAFNKAAEYLGLTVTRVPVAADFTADTDAMAVAVNDRTMMVVGSAPCFPFGVIDGIEQLSTLALERNLWLHVDACVGGYFAPFARMNGINLPPFDFALPGVRSMSADLHKYGYAAKGASTVFYRSGELREHQLFRFGDWPTGEMATPTLAGTRPGGAIAAAWAVMNYLGQEGYQSKAQTVIETREKYERGLEAIGGFQFWGRHQLGLLAFGSDEFDMFAVAEGMRDRGWMSAGLRQPKGMHLMLSPGHAEVADEYLSDMAAVVTEVRSGDRVAVAGGGSRYS
ncbi:MAG: aminotransferase class V-fold PLP-dependent enzyme [Alphaproteobacteria bacterium]|nr:aminotransferase class V-fold PLP-dependent enzyme [Alphaproteobacteria bacterium]